MSRYHVAAVFTQFPWLSALISPRKKECLEHAIVSRADIGTLDLRIKNLDSGDEIFFFDESGVYLASLRENNWREWFRTSFFEFQASRTVHEKLVMMGTQLQRCAYIVAVLSVRDPKSYVSTLCLTVFQAPKNGSIADLLSQKRQDEEVRLSVAMEEIQIESNE